MSRRAHWELTGSGQSRQLRFSNFPAFGLKKMFGELCLLLFLLGKKDKVLPKPGFSKPIFGHSAGSTKLDRPYCKQFRLLQIEGCRLGDWSVRQRGFAEQVKVRQENMTATWIQELRSPKPWRLERSCRTSYWGGGSYFGGRQSGGFGKPCLCPLPRGGGFDAGSELMVIWKRVI